MHKSIVFILLLFIAGELNAQLGRKNMIPSFKGMDAQDEGNKLSVYLLFPLFNHYNYYNATHTKNEIEDGCYGIGGGLAYTSGKNRFSADYTITAALSAILLSENLSGEIDYFKRCNILDLQYHRQLLSWLSVVGGLHTTSYHQSFFDTTGAGKYVDFSHAGMGFTAGLELIDRHYAGLGFYYRPSFISFNGTPSQQMLSFVLLIPLASVSL